jgi:hypothetical protein
VIRVASRTSPVIGLKPRWLFISLSRCVRMACVAWTRPAFCCSCAARSLQSKGSVQLGNLE